MLPMIQKEIVEKEQWATDEDVMNYFAVGQCTPGVIAVNTATFVGYKVAGTPGGIFATIGVVVPSILVITVIALFLKQFAHIKAVIHAFGGIRVAVAVLVANAVIKFWKSGIKDLRGFIIFIAAFVFSVFFNLSAVYIVIAALAAGIGIGIWKEKVKR